MNKICSAAGRELTAPAWFMAVYWFAQFSAWLALATPIAITIAIKVGQIAPADQKAQQLALVISLGAFGAMLSAPIWGAISDRTTIRMGRRKPWMIAGCLLLLAGLSLMASAKGVIALTLGWLICQIGSNAGQAALSAVLPDVIPRHRHGRMSGLLGFSVTAALLLGTFVTQFTQGSSLAMFLVPWLPYPLAVMLMLAFMPDRPARRGALERLSVKAILKGFWINPVRYPDFGWAFAGRFLISLATAFWLTYQVYFLTEQLHVPGSRIPAIVFMSTVAMGGLSVVVATAGGWLSDRFGVRKPFVWVGALFVSIGLLCFSVVDDVTGFMIAVTVTGFGRSLFFAVDLALCAAVLPDPDNAAKDLGVFQIANSLPQSLAPAIAPLLLSIGGNAANYPMLFIFACVAAFAGAITVFPIRGVR